MIKIKNRYLITSRFNDYESFREKPHLGIDFAMKKNTELRTIKDGVIERVISQPNGLGKAVYVKWNDGKTAIYGHMNEIIVKVNDKVEVGDLLGYSGNTGNVVGKNGGYHLHFAIKDQNGKFIDPEPYVPYIQEMNHKLLEIAKSDVDYFNIFNKALDIFSTEIQNIDFYSNLFNQ